MRKRQCPFVHGRLVHHVVVVANHDDDGTTNDRGWCGWLAGDSFSFLPEEQAVFDPIDRSIDRSIKPRLCPPRGAPDGTRLG
jgi:hypothetical protein